jgi:dTMP kinase
MKGVFITFEGPEGGGKTTQAGRLCRRLRELGREVVSVREPGGTRTGEALRDIVQHDRTGERIFPETEALLFAASRAQLVHALILPALKRGAWVVSDRFADSTTAYQGYGRGFDIETILDINAFAIGPAVPDLTFLLDVDTATGFDRLGRRNAAGKGNHDRIERETLAFHERVRRGYLRLARRWPKRFRVIDGRGDAEAVAESVWRAVLPRLRGRGKGRSGA